MIKLLKSNVKCQGHLKVKVIILQKGHDLTNNVCEYEVNQLTKNLLEENETLTQIVYDAGWLPGQIHQPISRNFLRKIQLKI